MTNRNAVVIGASSGGVDALRTLLNSLPSDFPAGVCAVLHLAASSPGSLPDVFSRGCALPVSTAQDGEAFEPGRVYLAPPDRHLLLKPGRLRVVRGPRENRARPAIDPLFRSAAVAYGSRLVGVILTGLLDDGSSGLAAVGRCGGVTVVQDPGDAAFPDMPLSALHAAGADHCVGLRQLPELLDRLVREEAAPNLPAPSDIAAEADIAERVMSDVPKENRLGQPAPFGCPGCGGPLWEMEDTNVKRYRCHVGHGYTAKTLLANQSEVVEEALWVALRTLEERAAMLRRMAQEGRGPSAQFGERADEAEQQALSIRSLLLSGLQVA